MFFVVNDRPYTTHPQYIYGKGRNETGIIIHIQHRLTIDFTTTLTKRAFTERRKNIDVYFHFHSSGTYLVD